MEKTHKNVQNYRAGKEPLKNAVMQHPTGNSAYDFIKGQIERNFWVTPFSSWEKRQKIRKR